MFYVYAFYNWHGRSTFVSYITHNSCFSFVPFSLWALTAFGAGGQLRRLPFHLALRISRPESAELTELQHMCGATAAHHTNHWTLGMATMQPIQDGRHYVLQDPKISIEIEQVEHRTSDRISHLHWRLVSPGQGFSTSSRPGPTFTVSYWFAGSRKRHDSS